MKTLLAAFLLITSPVSASPVDDYVACLIGESAVALHAQTGGKDASKAQEVAFKKCPEPNDVAADPEADGLYDFINLAVESIAAGVWPSQ